MYLETAFPIVQDGRIVVPKGSYVADTVTQVKRAGKMKGQSGIVPAIRFAHAPNGVTREFRSRSDSADGNDVTASEGKLKGASVGGAAAGLAGALLTRGATIRRKPALR